MYYLIVGGQKCMYICINVFACKEKDIIACGERLYLISYNVFACGKKDLFVC